MKVIVIGPQHSCTRLFTGILDKHPNIECNHWSVPSGMGGKTNWAFPIDYDPYTDKEVKYKVVIVNRDSNAIDLSNKEQKGISLSACISETSKKYIENQLLDIFYDDPARIIFASFELLANYKELYLWKLFKSIGVDPNLYNYVFTGVYEFEPKRWFSVKLDISDTNRKYLKLLY